MNNYNYTGEYQNIEINGNIIQKGKRECTDRWKIIKPFVSFNSTIIDIGSFHGYFGIKIAKEIKNTVVLSIEANTNWVEEQSKIVEMNNLMNIAVAKYKFSLDDLKWLNNVVEGIDYFIMLSVLEYFPLEDIEEIIKYISKISPNFIVEFPEKEETKAAGYNAIQKFSPFINYLKKYFENVQIIGKVQATTDHSMTRNIYLAQNKQIKREKLKSSKDHPLSRDHILKYKNNEWLLKEVDDQKRKWITGFNLHNLLKFNIIYPKKQWFLKNSQLKYQEVFDKYKEISDISLKNILFTSNELKIIDYLEVKNIKTQNSFNEHFEKFVKKPLNI